ncbi:hypothetical protein FC86_GL000504 [Holzapfeliella floricola DSM 23037 = JCM 16512]|uniref:DUF4097 domain-containing protein n=1 Tax=Holzapfeliella floricola DSM 23037 = JCM 16512 TaxID=1423744 RepID=A0A0R2DIW0_9LACO|nr:hypothetical protein FC86_GL000504 [Holzapfeliella floricola DSM 23037 = JCM 16512]
MNGIKEEKVLGKFFKYLGLTALVIILIALAIAVVNTLYHNQNMQKNEQTITATEDIKKLKVSSRYHVDIKYGDGYHLTSYTEKNKQPTVETRNGELAISTPTSWFSKVFSGLRFGNPPDYIELTVPNGIQLDNFDYHGQNGLTLPEQFNSQNVKLSSQFGNIQLTELQASQVDVSLQFGNISFNNTDLNTVKSSVQFGNLSFKDTKVNDLDGSVQFGNIEVKNQLPLIYDRMKFETQFGSVKLDTLEVNKLTTSAVFGGITKDNVTEK